jgi:hypothetical protein
VRETISSRGTFFIKFIFPAMWIIGVGWGAASEFAGRGDGAPASRWGVLALWVAGSAFFLWFCVPLKRVRLDGNVLRVSNFRREIAAPRSQIASVAQNRWLTLRPITIRFRDDMPFGRRITFIPPARFRRLAWQEDPIVRELRAASAEAGAV